MWIAFGAGAFSAKMFLVRIILNDKIDAYFKAGKLCPAGLGKGLG